MPSLVPNSIRNGFHLGTFVQEADFLPKESSRMRRLDCRSPLQQETAMIVFMVKSNLKTQSPEMANSFFQKINISVFLVRIWDQ